MPAGLPRVCVYGETGPAGCRLDEPYPGDIIAAPTRWGAIALQLDRCAQYPILCRGAVDDCNAAWQVIYRGAVQVEAARLVELQIEQSAELEARWPAWQVCLVVAGGVLTGLGLGAVAGYLTGL